MREDLGRLQGDLLKIPGVNSARVVGETAPTEIHIVASPERPAKQLVRDVQSLASARHGIPIDHRIVSVVQLEDKQKDVSGNGAGDYLRPQVERVVFAAAGGSGWVKVALRWPTGEVTEGVGPSASSRESRARGAMNAVVHALDPVIKTLPASVDVDHVVIQKVGDTDSVLVRALFHEGGNAASLVGSALIRDDVATAAVHALLHAINRKLEAAGAAG